MVVKSSFDQGRVVKKACKCKQQICFHEHDAAKFVQECSSSKTDQIIDISCDADNYVDSVLLSQPIAVPVMRTPVNSRKRNRSAPEADSERKKVKIASLTSLDSEKEKRPVSKATRNLVNSSKSKKNSDLKSSRPNDETNNMSVNSEIYVAEVHFTAGDNPDFTHMDILAKMLFTMTCDMRTMSANMQSVNTNMSDMIRKVHERIDVIEKAVEEKVTNKLTSTIDKRITSEINKLNEVVHEKVENAKKTFLLNVCQISTMLVTL
ncbi:hypothetical protein DPMN_125974 [Dreissena polymorpha]|uniref:Uncharacterized protein n=1 Tax=Dreissena polymorpha TaxID=45954 RepID=A0A9D4GYP8_DREPO|nr:hypothetical protein DPMN_125974 [Dreissena polymorpha]